jgi:hypothetical protein
MRGTGGSIGHDFRVNSGSYYLAEQAAADGDETAYGQVWVRNDTPNTLMFTDDAGNDHDLTAGGGATFEMQLKPQQAKLPSSNPATIDAGEDEWKLLFDDTTDECATWGGQLTPYDGGTLQADISYTLETTSTSDTVEMELSVLCVSDGDNLDSATYGTADAISSGSISLTAGVLNVITDASLNGDSCAEDDLIYIQICRDASVSSDADDVELRGAVIYE